MVARVVTLEEPWAGHVNIIELITNRWAWALVPTKLVESGNPLEWRGWGLHGNPARGLHKAPSHWTMQWNTYQPTTYLAHTSRGREEWENPKHKLAHKQQAIAITLSKELQASNCVYKSRGAPARGIEPPLYSWGTADQHCFEVNFA